MRTLALAIALIVALPVTADTWRWVDKDGQVHYSDRPVEGAELMELSEAQTFSTPPAASPAPRSARTQPDQEPEGVFRYTSVEFNQPQPDQVFWNVAGQVPLELALQPALQRGHTVRVFLDGEALENLPQTQTSFQLTEVYRGTHSIRVEISDNRGQVIKRSSVVTFHVRQTSLNRPANP